jgi:hypothetical protein
MSSRMGGTQYAARRDFRAAAGGHRGRIKGDRAFRQLLRRMPDAIRDEMVTMLEGVGDDIVAAQRAASPSARVRAALSRRVSRATLRLRVGLIGKPVNRRLFFARILEKGRKAQVVTARRGGGRPYPMRVRAFAGRPFVFGRAAIALRRTLGGRVSKMWDGALARASAGIGDE